MKDHQRGLSKGVMFGQRQESKSCQVLGKDSVPGREKCKSHERGTNLECLRNSRKTKVAAMERTERREEARRRETGRPSRNRAWPGKTFDLFWGTWEVWQAESQQQTPRWKCVCGKFQRNITGLNKYLFNYITSALTNMNLDSLGRKCVGRGLRHPYLHNSERRRIWQREKLNCDVACAAESSEARMANTMQALCACINH